MKTINDVNVGDIVTNGTDYAEVKNEQGVKYYANIEPEYIDEDAEIIEVNDMEDDHLGGL
jgi:hypothetical protein